MKKLLLMGSLVSGAMLSIATDANAQYTNIVKPKFLVNAPAGIAGSKIFSYSSDGSGGWGRAIDSFWYQVPVVKAVTDTLACSNLLNGTGSYPALTGKFCLLFRGDCEFGAKAKKAQDKGAIGVIMVNNIPGAPVGMGAGAVGAQVTIPVLMVSQSDGNAINAQLNAGQTVTVSLTNWGFNFTNDLGIVGGSPALGHAHAIPYNQLSNAATAYRMYSGSFIGNFGTGTQSTVKVKSTATWTPTGGSASVVHTDSVMINSFAAIDSVADALPTGNYTLSPGGTGKYTFNYTVSATNADQQPADNTESFDVYVTDSIFSKGRYDFTKNEPVVTGGYRFGGSLAGNVMTWGPLFYVTKGGYKASRVQFSLSENADPNVSGQNLDFGATRNGQSVLTYLFKWTDGSNGGAADQIIQESEVLLKGVASKTFVAGDSSGDIFTATFEGYPNNQLSARLEDNSWYWVAIATPDDKMFLGVDNSANYYTRTLQASSGTPSTLEYWAPQFVGNGSVLKDGTGSATNNLRVLPFASTTDIDSVSFAAQTGLVPAVALHLSKNPVTSAGSVASLFTDVNVFPNPAKEMLNVDIKLEKQARNVCVRLIDGLGRSIQLCKKENIQQTVVTLPVAGLSAGQYYVIVTADNEVTASPFTVSGK